jgi:hypothetical protein
MVVKSSAATLERLPEAFVSDRAITRAVSRAVSAGKLRKLASRLYTRNLEDAPETIIRRSIWHIAAGYFPNALIADRTALENAPAADGSICLIADTTAEIVLPGHRLRPRRGIGPLPGDRPFIAGLHLASTPRAWLENMRPSRARAGRVGRTLSRHEIETRLDTLVRIHGEEVAKRLRDDVRAIAPSLGLEAEADQLDALIGTLLGTRDAPLVTPAARARAKGQPWDPARLRLFETLHGALRAWPSQARPANAGDHTGAATLAFFEAYFSNFIEGTEFDVDEAADIVFRGVIPRERPLDAHDVLGTWRIVSNADEMRRTPRTDSELVSLLQSRHAVILAGRADAQPGIFKQHANRAGQTVFVVPELVAGTLQQGFDVYRSLEAPFQRAVFMMFLVAEIHPFADGNGRVARIMMNAELVAAGEQRIVIPTIYRADYLAALKALSLNAQPEPMIRALDFAQRWTHAIGWRSLDATRSELESCNAFVEPHLAERDGRRLRTPGDAGG